MARANGSPDPGPRGAELELLTAVVVGVVLLALALMLLLLVVVAVVVLLSVVLVVVVVVIAVIVAPELLDADTVRRTTSKGGKGDGVSADVELRALACAPTGTRGPERQRVKGESCRRSLRAASSPPLLTFVSEASPSPMAC